MEVWTIILILGIGLSVCLCYCACRSMFNYLIRYQHDGFDTDLVDERASESCRAKLEMPPPKQECLKRPLSNKIGLPRNHFLGLQNKYRVACEQKITEEISKGLGSKNDQKNELHPKNLNEKYKVFEKELGNGMTSLVYKCQDRFTGEMFAMKTIYKDKVKRKSRLISEVQILRSISHPGITEIIDLYESDKLLHIVTPLYGGGDLAHFLEKRTCVSEALAASIIFQVLDAVSYCHWKGIAHRDIKPENIMFYSSKSQRVVLIDFGLAFCKEDQCMSSFVGTPIFIAPEILLCQDHYCCKCDVWSLGILTYILLCGYPPFAAKNEVELYRLITEKEIRFPPPKWLHISIEAKQIISAMLVKDPSLRPSANDAKKNAWLVKYNVNTAEHQNLKQIGSSFI